MLLALFYAAFEIIEHPPVGRGLNFDFVAEFVIFAVVFPLTFGITLSLLNHAESERARAVRHLRQHHEFNQQLLDALDWDELARLLVRFPSTVAPLAGAALLLYDESSSRFELAAEWWDLDGHASLRSTCFAAPGFCHACAISKPGSVPSVVSCHYLENPCLGTDKLAERANHYCLSLVHGERLVALLQMYFPPRTSLTEEQAGVLSSVAPAMALAIDSARPRRSDIIRAEVAKAERRRIARQLHDSLGQNLGYLRLKLDEFTGENALEEIEAVRRDLERMRDIANEAYEQVRGTLVGLRSDSSIDLATALLSLAKSVGSRADFRVEFSVEGRPRPLPSHVTRHILDLAREALFNVEQHANARKVVIKLIWTDDALTINLADDGQGFDPDAMIPNGHFGLEIMRERAAEINGSFTLTSQPDAGTELTLQLPLAPLLQTYALSERPA
ncbi:MAG: hypothetical protein D6791_19075 [Chloroflexi bacterium]|nr:MAG: hypothetical protein D6791_19075 [Chloroflexota bacterium]